MNSSGDGGLCLLYGASVAEMTMPVCIQGSASGRNHLAYAIHVEYSRESIWSISASVFPRWPARRSLN